MALEAVETLHLYWISATKSGRYFENLCRSWSDALDNFTYVPIDLRSGAADESAAINALEQMLLCHCRFQDSDFYIAGPQALAVAATRLLTERGLPHAQLHFEILDV
jgi:CDP-4-dehydro-6-deoxyglucose reductase